MRVGGTLYDRVRFAEWNGKEAYLDHGIVAVLLVHIGEVNDARAELEKGAVEEPIDKENQLIFISAQMAILLKV